MVTRSDLTPTVTKGSKLVAMQCQQCFAMRHNKLKMKDLPNCCYVTVCRARMCFSGWERVIHHEAPALITFTTFNNVVVVCVPASWTGFAQDRDRSNLKREPYFERWFAAIMNSEVPWLKKVELAKYLLRDKDEREAFMTLSTIAYGQSIRTSPGFILDESAVRTLTKITESALRWIK